MKRNLQRMSLKARMLVIFIAVFSSVFVAILLMFLRTTRTLEENTVETLELSAKEIGGKIDELVMGIQNVSDAFANEPTLDGYLSQTFDSGQIYDKFNVLQEIRNHIFNRYNILRDINKISAIYNVQNRQLFNFVDVNLPDEAPLSTLQALDVTNPEKLSKYYWYPLQSNFLRSMPQTDIRLERVIVASRRIYSRASMTYPYVHIFVVPEQKLFDSYSPLLEQTGGEAYILSGKGELLSSSDLGAVTAGQAPPALQSALAERKSNRFTWKSGGGEMFVSVHESGFRMGDSGDGGWRTVLVVPKQYVTQRVNEIYLSFFAVLALCIFLCGLMVFYLYRQFMNPISTLGQAMERVENGDLQAYIQSSGGNSEAVAMIRRYNHMLEKINIHLEEKLVLEKTAKELDMQVLTDQINPHFLYNTLETIVWKANEAARPDIGKIAASLGKMYRLSVNNGETWTSLEHELEHVQNYIALQKSRYGDQFRFSARIQEHTLQSKVPKLIVQPIVENIFLHALPEAEKSIQIRLTVRQRNNAVILTVLDNGCGMSRERLALVRKHIAPGNITEISDNVSSKRSSGIGLRNVSARLELYLGEAANLLISSKQGLGTKVVLTIGL